MTETEDRPYATKPRTVRMHNDAWNLMEAETPEMRSDPSKFTRDMTEAGLDLARCRTCFALVHVEFGDLTGKPLAEWVAEAQKTVTRQHRDGHHPVTVGRGADRSPAAMKFLPPQPPPVITAPVPDRKKGRRA